MKRGSQGAGTVAATCSSDSGEDSGQDSGDAEDSAPGPYRFWATEAPYAGPRSDARLVLRRPGGSTTHDVADASTALLLPSEVPAVMGREHQSRILFVALLENYCRTYDDDPLRNRRLFFAICRTLYSMGIIGKEYVDELSSVRATYSDAFRELVTRAQASLAMYEQHDIESGIRSLMSGAAAGSASAGPESSLSYEWSDSMSGASVMMDAQRSRYHDDFVQLRCLGRGGFGKVYEVRNKLDGRPYAVKLIKIKGEITAEKTLREIKTLANLDHPNIVRYYSSWLEVSQARKRLPPSYRDPRSASPLMNQPRGPSRARAGGQRRLVWMGSDDENDVAELSSEWHTIDSVESPNVFASSPESLDGIRFQSRDSSADQLGSSGGGSACSASPWAALGGDAPFGRRRDNSEAAVIAEVSIGHTHESREQRRAVEDSVVFEHSGPVVAVMAPEPIPIGEDSAGLRHRRQHSLHTGGRALCVAGPGVGRGARSVSVLETLSGEPHSLPTQALAPAMMAETTLFVQMQLCQTTLQEFLSQRNERIARGKPPQPQQQNSGAGPEWRGASDQDLLIDPVMNVRLFRAIVEGVKYFHNRGVIHRDLKGANVFLDVVYADSGGDPLSRAGSGIGRPGASSGALTTTKNRVAALSPFGSSAGLGSAHADAWDTIDGGNLKGRLPDDAGHAASAEGCANGRHVDWDAVFGSIVANRNISAGRAAASGVAPAQDPPMPGDNAGDDEQPPMVAFIPRIGDFGLATKATLGPPAADDDGAVLEGDGSARCSPASSSGNGAAKLRPTPRWPHAGEACDMRRTSNVGTITYAAPEQLRDQTAGYNEKADIYSLGIIFFELYYPFSTAMERAAVIKDLRRGVFPAKFLQAWPKEAAFILHLMDVDPARRPSAKEILSLDLIDVPTLESAQLRREVLILKQQLRAATLRNEELGLRVRELERIVDMTL
ncbi:hypothetical protein H4R21_002115 [Coemansia helicoidea]|uniref:Uncharacterized protein n=1 Tax=Coemansia helicoidea TaxID=1286919 RepID=A0ACC1L8W7_9FUNG|nr:hypothetical protein H4R21_002115 [Coemansia helicoidea]